MLTLVSGLILLLGPAADPPASAPAAASAPSEARRVSAAELDRLVDQLSHPRFELRETATTQLCRLDPAHLAALVKRYHEETRYEPKRRLRYVIETIFLRPILAGRDGFMGIQVRQQVMSNLPDPQTGKRVRGLGVETVLEGQPAQRAGLRNGDVIIAIDGAPLPDDPTPASFIKIISERAPGTALKLRVLRARKEPRIMEVTVGQEPRRILEGATLQTSPGGVRVVEVMEDSPAAAAGLNPNDLIKSIEGREISDFTGAAVLDQTLGTIAPGATIRLGVQQVGAEEIRVVLGARPVELMQPSDWAEARNRFHQWWQEQGGESSARPQTTVRLGVPSLLDPETTIIP